jgi:hypothetical protein
VKTLDAKTLSEVALALCLAGAVVVWLGLRLDRYIVRWAGMAVIVVGLMGLIFQGSLTHQTLASQSSFTFAPPSPTQSPTPSPSPQPTPKPTPSASPKKKKPKKTTTTTSGGYVPPAPPVPQPNPPSGGGGGGTPPFQGSPVP